MQKRGVLREHHVRACQLKVEEGLSDSEIARRTGFNRVSVGRWWTYPYVIRYLAKLKRDYSMATAPRLLSDYEYIRDQVMSRLSDYVNPDGELLKEINLRDLVMLLNTATEKIDDLREMMPKADESDKERAYDEIHELLTEEEKEVLVRRLLENQRRKQQRQGLVQDGPAISEVGALPGGVYQEEGAGEL